MSPGGAYRPGARRLRRISPRPEPRDVSGPRTFWAVFSGNVLGTCLYAGLGIYITAMAPSTSSVASIGAIAGTWILPILALSLLGSDAIGTVLAEAGYRTFLTSFENLIYVLLFFFVRGA